MRRTVVRGGPVTRSAMPGGMAMEMELVGEAQSGEAVARSTTAALGAGAWT